MTRTNAKKKARSKRPTEITNFIRVTRENLANKQTANARSLVEILGPAPETLPQLQREEIVRLIDIMRGQNEEARDAAMVFLFHNILEHCNDGTYIFDLSVTARDRALYRSEFSEHIIKAFAAKVHPRISEQLAEWEG